MEKYMEKLLNAENEWDQHVRCEKKEGPHCCISKEEMRNALQKMKNRKVAGPSKVVSETKQQDIKIQNGCASCVMPS